MATTELSVPTTTSLGDLGLLILWIGTGAAMLQAGLRKMFDYNTTAGFMESGGWRLPKLAAFMVIEAETAGGLGLLLGLLTPLAACAVIAVMIDAWAVNVPVQCTVPAGHRRDGAAVDRRRRRVLAGCPLVRPPALACSDRDRTADSGDRRRDRDLDLAERHEPDPLQRPSQLKRYPPVGPSPYSAVTADPTGQ